MQKATTYVRALTLLEIMIAMATLAVFFSFTARTFYVFQKGLKEDQTYFVVNENARRAIDCLSKDIRQASQLPANTILSNSSDFMNVVTDSATITYGISIQNNIKMLTRESSACAAYIENVIVTSVNNITTVTVNTKKSSIFGDERTFSLSSTARPRNI